MELITGRPAINNNLPLRICYKNVIKLVCIYHFSKKKKKKCGMDLWRWHCRNRRKKKIVAIGLWQWHCRNRGGKIVGMNLWQWHCRNRRKKKLLQLVCDNGIAEIGGKEKKYCLILAMALPK